MPGGNEEVLGILWVLEEILGVLVINEGLEINRV